MSELYAGTLGRQMGLPIPSFALSSISKPLLLSFSDLSVRSALGEGVLFASLWQEPIEVLRRPDLFEFNTRDLAALYVFDHWVQNGDRTLSEHGGNANLFVRLRDKALVVIDHNLAFSPSYTPDELRVHACRSAWLDQRLDLVFKDEITMRMRQAMAVLPSLELELPDEWIAQDPGFSETVREALLRFDTADFWAEMG